MTDTALHAEDQPIVGQRQVIDLIEIGDEGIEVSAELEQLGPVFGVARQPGGFEAQDDADMAHRDFCCHVLEAGPLGEAAGGDAEVVRDGDGVAPAEGDRSRRPTWIRVLSA